MAKIRNFDSFGAVFPHLCSDKREIWRRCQISRLSGQHVAPAGRKTHFPPLSNGCDSRRPAGNKT